MARPETGYRPRFPSPRLSPAGQTRFCSQQFEHSRRKVAAEWTRRGAMDAARRSLTRRGGQTHRLALDRGGLAIYLSKSLDPSACHWAKSVLLVVNFGSSRIPVRRFPFTSTGAQPGSGEPANAGNALPHPDPPNKVGQCAGDPQEAAVCISAAGRKVPMIGTRNAYGGEPELNYG